MEGANVRIMAGQEETALAERVAQLEAELEGPRGRMPHLRPGIEHQLSVTRQQLIDLTETVEVASERPQLSSHDDLSAADLPASEDTGLGL
jgi:hypothetical protein